MKKFINASEVQVGDTLCFASPRLDVTIERISEARSNGAVGLHAKNDTWSSFYKPTDRVRVLARPQ